MARIRESDGGAAAEAAAQRAAEEAAKRAAEEAARQAAVAAAAAAARAAAAKEGMSRRNSGFEHKALKAAGPVPSQESGTDVVARRTSGFDHKAAGPTPSLQGTAARRASGFDQVAVRRTTGDALRMVVPPAAAPTGPVTGVGNTIPPLTSSEQQRLGSSLPPTGGPQLPWGRNDGFAEPTALAGTIMTRAQEQGLLPQAQLDRSADVANRAIPSQDVRQLTALDVGALAREAGVPVERLDAGQLTQAARLINGATSPQDQRDRIALSLNNLSVASGRQLPELTRQDLEATLWAQAKVPGHALQGLSDEAVRALFSDVNQAVNHPGSTEVRIGNHNLKLSVGDDGALLSTETKPVSIFTKIWEGGLKDALGKAVSVVGPILGKVFKPDLGPAYPTTPEARAQDLARLTAAFGPAIDKLPSDLREVIDQIRGLGISDVDALRGSHVIIEDGGAAYDQWRQLGASRRSSSHYSDVDSQQYQLIFPGVGPMLFGKDAAGNTFFQFEGHAEEDPAHAEDFKNYALSGLNIGPGGASPHNDSNPIRVGG